MKSTGKKKVQANAPTPSLNKYYIVAVETPKTFTGIIGPLDVYTVHFLLTDGKSTLKSYSNESQIATELADQGIYIQRISPLGPGEYIIYVDNHRTNVAEFSNWKSTDDPAALSWRTYIYPCHKGTTKEALGFAVCAKKEAIDNYSLSSLFTKILEAQV
jgi:hypothetical protein